MRRHHLGRRVIRRHHLLTTRFFRLGHQRPFPFDPIEDHRGKKTVSFAIKHLRRVRIQQNSLAAVREHVTTAAERIAESRALSPVHHIRGHHAKIQRGGHLKKHLKFIHLRLILRRGDVELDEPVHRFLARALADAQMSRLTTNRTNAAGLDAKLVEPAMLRPSLPEPVRRECVLDRAREKQPSQRLLDAKPIQHRLLILATAVAQFRRCLAQFACVARRIRKRTIQHQFRRAVVAIHMRRRERKLRADALKAMPAGVFIQFARLRGIVAHTEQIIDRVLVLRPAQPIMRDRRPRRHPRRPALLNPRIEARNKRRDLLLRRLLLLLRRHLARIDLLDHFRPMMRVRPQLEVPRELVDAQITLLLFRAVARDAVFLQKSVIRLCTG